MTSSALQVRDAEPSEQAVRTALAAAWDAWVRLRDGLHRECAPLTEEWQWSAPAKGWSFRLKQPKRVLVYMLPQQGAFMASFSLGEQAWLGARALRLPAAVREILESAPKYAEGRGVRIRVRTKADANAVVAILVVRSTT